MIIKYRMNSLETNSSSAHALVWDSEKSSLSPLNYQVDDNGMLTIDFNELNELDELGDQQENIYAPQYLRKLAMVHESLHESDLELLNKVYGNLCQSVNAHGVVLSFQDIILRSNYPIEFNHLPSLGVSKNLWKLERFPKHNINNLDKNTQAQKLADFVQNNGCYIFDYNDNFDLSDIFTIPPKILEWFEQNLARSFGLSNDVCMKALHEIMGETPIETIIFNNKYGNYPVYESDYQEVSKDNMITSKFNWNDFNEIIDKVFNNPEIPLLLV